MGSPEKPIESEMVDMNPTIGFENTEKAQETAPLQDKEPLNEETEESERFTGLKKKELLEIANQRQWKLARTILFILFWLLWVGMLVAAILIVVNAPRCKPKPTSEWYQDTVVYKADPEKFAGDYNGVAKHIQYIKNMRAALLLSNVMGEDMKTPLNDVDDSFNKMVETAHKNDVKVMVELKIDSLSTVSSVFNQSYAPACKNNKSGVCSLFLWANNTSTGMTKSPYASAYYQGTSDKAYINYNSNYAHQYLTDALDKWLERKVDGFLITDVSEVREQGYDYQKVVETAWKKVSNASTKENKKALMIEALGDVKDSVELSKLYSIKNGTIGVPTPLVVYKPLAGNTIKSAKKISDAVKASRKDIKMVSTYQNNAGGKTTNQSLALTILNIALPGVSVLKSGEEFGDVKTLGKFKWNSKADSHTPVAAESEDGKFASSATLNMIKKKFFDTLSKPSLRYDTQDQDTKFMFTETNNTKVLAFCRKWDKKPTAMVISNIDGAEQKISINSTACANMDANGKILVSSNNYDKTMKVEAKVDFAKFKKIAGYTTIVVIN